MGIFSCPCVVRLVCVPGAGGLLKLSQPGRNWQAGRSWQAGKCWMVSEVEWYWGMFSAENNGIEPDGNI